MLKGIEFARRRDWPYLGTCAGFQYAFIEFARNVLHIADADSAENNSGSKNIIIYPVACAVPDRNGNAPKLSGAVPEIRLRPGSYLQTYYGKNKEVVTEEFFCNFEINPEFEWTTMQFGGLRAVNNFSKTLYPHGAIMAATVLNSKRAIEMSVFVVRAFVEMRQAMAVNQQVVSKLSELEGRLDIHDAEIQDLVVAIQELIAPLPPNNRRIGFETPSLAPPAKPEP